MIVRYKRLPPCQTATDLAEQTKSVYPIYLLQHILGIAKDINLNHPCRPRKMVRAVSSQPSQQILNYVA